jgi:hypothetical protein
MSTRYRLVLGSVLAVIFMLFAVHVFAQSAPTATESTDLRIKCKMMSDQKALEIAETNRALHCEIAAARNSSKYDAIRNRCYGRIYQHLTKGNVQDDFEGDAVLDLQTGDLLATGSVEKGEKHGSIFDPGYKKLWLPSCAGGCPPNFGAQTWQAVEDYMNELMADPNQQ